MSKKNKPYHVITTLWDGDTEIKKKLGFDTLQEAIKVYAKIVERGAFSRIWVEAHGVKI